MKAIIDASTVNKYIDLHKKMQIPFTMTLSTYTTRIQSNLIDLYFMQTEQPNRVFAAFAQIKNQCIKKPVNQILKEDLQYYSHTFKPHNLYADKIFNIDLKSAYATVLHKDGYIDEKLFNYINRLPKMERLTAVGMLAGKKNIFEINAHGEAISNTVKISETADYFFHCVKRISETINEAAQHLGDAFLFSWVDGVYFLQDEESANTAAEIIIDFFASKGFKCSFDVLTNFEVISEKKYYRCKYMKGNEKKTMNVPKQDTTIVKKIENYLLTKQY